MSQQIALIVHHIMDEPDKFVERNDSVTNGYYEVRLDGTRYGMGAASYVADGAEREMLLRAVAIWKEDTGWQPKQINAADSGIAPQSRRIGILPDVFIRQAYEEFAHAVKAAQKSFVVHSDTSVMMALIQKAISKLDAVLRPMEKIEGKRQDAEGGGVSGS